MEINALVIFHKVAETNSFSVASRILEIPISTISRKINKLEEDLQRKLLLRSTRKVSLTPEGQVFYDASKNLFNDIHDLAHVFTNEKEICGDIRVTATIEHRNFILPFIVEFKKQYPGINFHLNFSNDVQDLIENSFDFAFRAGQLKNSSMYAHKLYSDSLQAYMHKYFYSPQLLSGELSQLEYAMMTQFSTVTTKNGQSFKPEQKIVSNSVEFLLSYAQQRPIIAYLPKTHVSEDFVHIDFFKSYETSFHLVYLHKKLNKPCSLFLNFFKQKDFSNFHINHNFGV